jgi:putative transposase
MFIMSQYRRLYIPGSTYFLTVNLYDRTSALLIDHVNILRSAFSTVKCRHPFALPAIVILPDHMHLLMTLPEGDSDFSLRIRLIKRWFTTHLPVERSTVWQKRFWEHVIRNEADLVAHVNYIHINPVKHGYVDAPEEWAYSSIHRYVADERLPKGAGSVALVAGERG